MIYKDNTAWLPIERGKARAVTAMNYDARLEAERQGDRASETPDRLGDRPNYDPFGGPDEGDRRRQRRNLILMAGSALALIGLWFVIHKHTGSDPAASAANQAPAITVFVPGRTMVEGTISATGSLAARHEMPVGSVGDGGEVTRVLVNAGDWVKQGQLLATVDRAVQSQQLANQQAGIGVAQADAQLAQANLDRALKLVDRGFISHADIDRLTATRDAARARVRVAQAQRGEASAKLQRLNIVAPADGLVLERAVEPGQVVGPSSGVLFRIAEHGAMEMRARLSETDLAQLSLGQTAQVTPTGSAQAYTGTIWQISPAIDAQTRQGTARIALAYAPAIRPGGFASAEIRSGAVQAPLLPESALQADARGSFVYVIGAGNKAERRSVKIGLITDKGAAITGGLSGTERVVLRAGAFLSPGEAVQPKLVSGS